MSPRHASRRRNVPSWRCDLRAIRGDSLLGVVRRSTCTRGPPATAAAAPPAQIRVCHTAVARCAGENPSRVSAVLRSGQGALASVAGRLRAVAEPSSHIRRKTRRGTATQERQAGQHPVKRPRREPAIAALCDVLIDAQTVNRPKLVFEIRRQMPAREPMVEDEPSGAHALKTRGDARRFASGAKLVRPPPASPIDGVAALRTGVARCSPEPKR